jgi:hypothetical protein
MQGLRQGVFCDGGGNLTEYPNWDIMPPMHTATSKLLADARTAFRKSGMSMRRLSQTAGTSYSIAHRFVSDETRDVQLSTLVRLLDGFGYELRLVKRKG